MFERLKKFIRRIISMAKLNLSAPWDEYYEEIKCFFGEDELTHVVYDREKYIINIYVEDGEKATALDQLLIEEIHFGDITLSIDVIPANEDGFSDKEFKGAELFDTALNSNCNYAFARTVQLLFNNPLTYVVFSPEIAQYYTDDLGDWNGFRTTLYQEIAKDIFVELDGVHYCTDEKVVDLGTWL